MSAQSTSKTTRADSSYNRRRAGTVTRQACNVCRSRKTKCDNKRPVCGFCAQTGGQCGYNDESLDHSRLDRGSLLILQRVGELEQTLTNLITHSLAGAEVQTVENAAQPSHPPASVVFDQASDPPVSPIAGLLRLLPKQEVVPQTAESGNGQSDNPPTADVIYASTEMTVESLLTWPAFRFSESGQRNPSLINLLCQKSRDRSCDSASDGHISIDVRDVKQLVANFLSVNHTKNPIFNVESLWAEVNEFVEDGLAWDGRSCLILLVCAVSILSPPPAIEWSPGPSKQPERLAQAQAYFDAAQKRIGAVYHDNSLLVLQCNFLTAVYLMSTMSIYAAWKSFSQAGTQCLGWLATRGRVHGSSSHLLPPSADDDESAIRYVEESLYWSCLKSELELRTELGLPGSSLNEMRYPHLYPSPPVPMPNSWTGAAEVTDQTRSEFELGWFFYLAEIALRRIMNDALSVRYRPSSWYYRRDWWIEKDEAYLQSYVEEFTVKLDAWYNTLPSTISFSYDPRVRMGDVLRGILRGHVVDIREVVLYPALRALMFRPLHELGPRTLHLARQALHNDVDRILACQEGFWYRHQGTWLMIRSCTRSCLHLLAVGLRSLEQSELTVLLPDDWQEAVGSVLRLIEYWKDESFDLQTLLETLQNICARVNIQ